MNKKRSAPWFLIGTVLLLVVGSVVLFSSKKRNIAPVDDDPKQSQAQLPAPKVNSVLATDSSMPANDEPFSPENCQLALDIPWEHDVNNPITDEDKILEILRALGDLEECLYARQDGWLHYYTLRNGQRAEEEVLVHLIEGGSSVDLRYDLSYNQGRFTAKKYYDGRNPEKQWCNVSDEAIRQVVQVKRNCKTTEVYHLLTGNGDVDGYVGMVFYTFLAEKNYPSLTPGYYLPEFGLLRKTMLLFLLWNQNMI